MTCLISWCSQVAKTLAKARQVFFSFSMKSQSVHLLFALVHKVIPICMEKSPKMIIILFLLHVIACKLSLFHDHAMVLLPTVNTLPQLASLSSTWEWIFKGTSSLGVFSWGGAFNSRHMLMGHLLPPCSESASTSDLCFFAITLHGLHSDMFPRRRTIG
jgi:hypothetical protein